MRSFKYNRGQQVIEYLLVSTAVALVLITGVLLKGGPFVQATNGVMKGPSSLLEKNKDAMKFANATGSLVTF